jgi:hypothetical protein
MTDPVELPELIIPNVDLDGLITGADNSAGAVNVLFDHINSILLVEYEKGRLKGSEYAQVVSTAIATTIPQAIQFLLNKDTAKYQAYTALVNARVALADLSVKEKQIELMDKELLLKDKEIDIKIQELALAEKQVDKMEAEIGLINETKLKTAQETARMVAEINLINQNKLKAIEETNKLESEIGLINENTIKTIQEAENLLIEKEVLTKNALKIAQDTLTSADQACVYKSQYNLNNMVKDKTQAEIDLINQKKITEKAQVDSTVIGSNSLLDKQRDLLTAQETGFGNDAKVKVLTQMVNAWSTGAMANGTTTTNTNLDNVSVGKVVEAVAEAIVPGLSL